MGKESWERNGGEFITKSLGLCQKSRTNEVRTASLPRAETPQNSSPARGGFKFVRPLPHPHAPLIRSS